MPQAQQAAARRLLRSALSELGYAKSTTIMQLEGILNVHEAGKGANLRDPLRYYLTICGTPAEQGSWGLSIEGHHLSFNFAVRDGQLVDTTPQFMGANPAVVKGDLPDLPQKGTRVLRDEEQLAFELVDSLDAADKAKAVLAEESLKEIRAAGEPRSPAEPPESTGPSGSVWQVAGIGRGFQTASLNAFVVISMCADPGPHDLIVVKSADRPVVNANTNRPQVAPHFLEVERRMKGILLPEAVGPGSKSANITGELAIGPPKIKARNAWDRHGLVPTASSSSRIVSSGTVRPASQSALADAMSPSSFPAAASAESWRSHSSSTAGWSIDISSQYSCGESRSMAALISRSDVMWRPLHEQQTGPEVLRMRVRFQLQLRWLLSTDD
jgi:hypothetical protein